jgi:hypothetical protein
MGLLTSEWNRGQYSDAVLNELESQNDGQVDGILGKVRQLKDVCSLCSMVEGRLLTEVDDYSHWRRNPGVLSAGGENERFVR